MIRLQNEGDYRARLHELMALEDIVDHSLELARRAGQSAHLYMALEMPLETFAHALVQAVDAYLDSALTIRRDSVRLYEDMVAAHDSPLGTLFSRELRDDAKPNEKCASPHDDKPRKETEL